MKKNFLIKCPVNKGLAAVTGHLVFKIIDKMNYSDPSVYYYIYIITNTINKKSYVGSRLYNSREPYWGSSKYLKEDIKKYGLDSFSKQIIGIYPFINKNELLNRESDFILCFSTLNPSGYNRKLPNNMASFYTGGEHLSIEHKTKISKAKKGKETWMKGKKHNIEAKLKISEAGKGRTPPNKGKTPSADTIEKLKIARAGRVFSEETKQKMKQTHLKRWAKIKQGKNNCA